jgi:hypothetical protein
MLKLLKRITDQQSRILNISQATKNQRDTMHIGRKRSSEQFNADLLSRSCGRDNTQRNGDTQSG